MRQELARARAIHESMFPAPLDDGFVRFEYTYTPMRELGGDYVHLEVTPQGLVHLTLIDVTGHGLAAALTVNRLFGELERIRGESPLAGPGEVLALLNRYINLTMVKHNIFVTALCLTLDPCQGKLYWANAGHPPGFLRGANGVVTSLPATSVLLGALDGGEFSADQRSIELSPGDVIVAFTDGAFEVRDRLGRSLGLNNLAQLLHVQPPPRNWPQFIASIVHKHSAGRNDDDILIASLKFKAPRPQATHAKQAMAAS
jgi:sigma-B regulation protein RsbU (phosphoserine phosphatase)